MLVGSKDRTGILTSWCSLETLNPSPQYDDLFVSRPQPFKGIKGPFASARGLPCIRIKTFMQKYKLPT